MPPNKIILLLEANIGTYVYYIFILIFIYKYIIFFHVLTKKKGLEIPAGRNVSFQTIAQSCKSVTCSVDVEVRFRLWRLRGSSSVGSFPAS